MRKIDILIPVWGKRYCDYLVNDFLPSLMTPHNLPLLQAVDGHRLLLATPWDDWIMHIRSEPIINEISHHVTVKIIPIEPQISGEGFERQKQVIAMQDRAQRLLLEEARRHESLASLHSPDCIINDGMISSICGTSRRGKQALLSPATRQSEERVRALGCADFGRAVCQLHPDMAMFEQNDGIAQDYMPFRYWSFPEGILLHNFFSVMLMVDMRAVGDDHLSKVENIETQYFGRNFRPDQVEIVGRPMIISLTPEATNWSPPLPPGRKGWWREVRSLRLSMDVFSAGMPLNRKLFKEAVYWNFADITADWIRTESRFQIKVAIAEMAWVGFAIRAGFWAGVIRRTFLNPAWVWATAKRKLRGDRHGVPA